jgi:hypothetical protein
MRKFLFSLLGTLSLGVAGASAQSNIVDTGLPVLDPDDVLPVAGTVVNENKVVFSGTATDTAGTGETISGVDRVEYRITGYKKWRRATLTARGEASTDFFFTVSIRKGSARTVLIRVLDGKKNESDTLGRKVRHSKVLVREASGDSGTANPPAVTPIG